MVLDCNGWDFDAGMCKNMAFSLFPPFVDIYQDQHGSRLKSNFIKQDIDVFVTRLGIVGADETVKVGNILRNFNKMA